MCQRITHKRPVLIGVSMGGMLVQEMSDYLDCEKVIIISSVKSDRELPSHMRLAKFTNAHKLIPTKWIKNIDNLALFAFGNELKKRFELYDRYLSERDPYYLSWAINCAVKWERANFNPNLIHIHGKDDAVFPIKNIEDPFIQIKGDHSIILTQYEWFNKFLPKIINGNFDNLIL